MENQSYIYGIRAISEAIQSGADIQKVFLQTDLKGRLFSELEKSLKNTGISVSYVPAERLNRITRGNHQGAIAMTSPVAFVEMKSLIDSAVQSENTPLMLLLDRVSDVRNMGALIRTAECSGVNGILVPRSGSAPINEDTVKTSAGAVFNMPISKVDHLKDAIYYLQGSGIPVIALTEKTTNSLYDLDLSGPVALLMGAEDSGIHPSLLKIVDHRASLPLLGTIGSLNVSVACGVALYEVVRQRTQTG